ncbi:MAG: M48 family metallopeptidase [Nanoarchaeota archaeon]
MSNLKIDFRDQISKNNKKSFFLMLSIFLILILFGYLISFAFSQKYFFIIMIISIIFSLGYLLIGFYKSDKIAITSVGAKKADKIKYKQYYGLVHGLTLASGLPMPELYVMNSNQINAFASGRNPENSVICVTTGALEKLEKRELEAVLAHELGHIANYDIRFITLVTILVGMIAIISEIFLRSLWFSSIGDRDNRASWIFILIGILMAILAPITVKLIQLSISRKREFSADASSVRFTRYPDALIKALKKIKADSEAGITSEKKVSKAVAPLFFTNPLKGLGSTHPSIEKRIQILERM